MRIAFVMLSALMGCLALLLGPTPGRSQFPGAPPPDRERLPKRRPPAGPPPRPVSLTDRVDERFRQLDRDGDGYLNSDEMTENLTAEKDRWDVNRDGWIDLAEWREYVRALIAQQRRSATDKGDRTRDSGRGPRNRGSPGRGEARLPLRGDVLSRLRPDRHKTSPATHDRKLPSNLPAWFKDYDRDGDGQIALYEWKDKKRTVKGFLEYDLNEDGFITLAELIRSGHFAENTGKRPPRTVSGLRAQSGEFFYFEVTGTLGGTVWGTDVYTTDSPIAAAAVHAGLLQIGQTRLVKVTILPGQQSYRGSVRNGVVTRNYGPFASSYRVELAP
jgi:Ca2+-binding EF-hand superfamily protein